MEPTTATKLLIVDDEPAIRKLLQRGLASDRYSIIATESGQEAIEIAARQSPDLILLDINLATEPDGLEVCRQVRTTSKIPIIMLTVRDEKRLRLAALNAGADDYVTKPFDMDELEARIRAVLRRIAYEGAQSPSGKILVDDLVIDLVDRRVMLHEDEVHLTPTEYELLCLFATNPGKVLTFELLLREIWGQSVATPAKHSVRVFVNTLRKKLKDDPSSNRKRGLIINEPSIGYRFTDI